MPSLSDAFRQLLPVHRAFETVRPEEARATAPGALIELPLGSCHYVAQGLDGPPVLLLHGFLYHTVMWEGVQGTLARRGRTFALDLLGWGWSARNEAMRYDYALYARQVLQFMDAMGLERAALVGQSMGAGTAIRFAVEHPDRVERLVLIDAASLPNPLALPGRLLALPGVGELALALGREALVARNLRTLWFHDPAHVTDAYVARVTAPLRIEGSSWTLLNILRELDFGSQLQQVKALGRSELPILLIWGREDKAVPFEVGLHMRDLLPRARFVVIPHAGHTPHEENPDAFLKEAIPFLFGDEPAA